MMLNSNLNKLHIRYNINHRYTNDYKTYNQILMLILFGKTFDKEGQKKSIMSEEPFVFMELLNSLKA